jgi:hypothetical protein
MQLHAARLCIDCQEIHDSQTCPVCSSESFAYISRWIPAPERRLKPRPPAPAGDVDAYRQLLAGERSQPPASRWLKRGMVGFAAVGAAAWAWKRAAGSESPRGEPRTPSGALGEP